MNEEKKYKIAIISPVPFYYHIPFYKSLSKDPSVSLSVIYCSKETLYGQDINRMYNSPGHIVDQDSLLSGYNYKFLKNYSPMPSFMNWPFGLMNFGVWKEIRKGNYDAVILQSWTNLTWWIAFFACILFKTSVLFMTDSNVSAEIDKSNFKKTIRKIILGKMLFKKVGGFLTSGTANEQFYRYYGVTDSEMVRVPFSWGYDELLKEGDVLIKKRNILRKEYKIQDDDFVFLYVGRLSPEKDVETLLLAYNNIDSNRSVKLIMVGDGPIRDNIEKKIKEMGIRNISILGFQKRDSIFNYYVISDALVLPSKSETWGIVVNEAMCYGLPIIASDKVGAAVDLIKEGLNGFVFKTGDYMDLFNKMNNLIFLSNEKITGFRMASRDIITKWVNSIKPVEQIINIIKKNNKK